jgi:hypothetical protein
MIDLQTREDVTIEVVNAITTDLGAWTAGRPATGGLIGFLTERLEATRQRIITKYGDQGARAFQDALDAILWTIDQRHRRDR